MILIALEICLTIIAWFRGWRFYSLLPIAGLLLTGALMGLAAGLYHIDLTTLGPVCVVPDVMGTLVLSGMAVRGFSKARVRV